jgi:dsDNA-binding SOS-regulon protein
VKELLNDEQYKLYQDYEATVGERMQLTQLNQQLTQKSMPLDEAQQEELITIMIEEREKTGLASTKERHAEWLNGVPPDEVLNQRLEQQAEVNQRVYERSSDTLSEPQRTELKTFQEGQLQMQKLGIQMMKGFMSQEKEPAAP